MRHVLIAAAALTAGAFLAATAAKAQVAYQAGGPVKIGNMCKVSTDINPEVDNYGYYGPCGYRAAAQAPGAAIPHAAKAQVAYQAGGPVKIGNMCKVSTDINPEVDSYGYYEPCKR